MSNISQGNQLLGDTMNIEKFFLSIMLVFSSNCTLATGIPVYPIFTLSGNELQSMCDKSNDACLGYVIGIIDHESMVKDANSNIAFYFQLGDRTAGSFAQQAFCFSRGVTTQQNVSILRKYLADNPDKLHTNAVKLVTNALKMTFLRILAHVDHQPIQNGTI